MDGKALKEAMCEMLINDAWDKGVTEISLDATMEGRPLYKNLGFKDSDECMVLTGNVGDLGRKDNDPHPDFLFP